MQQAASTASIVCAVSLTSNECESSRNRSEIATRVLVETDYLNSFSPTGCAIRM